jgi:hypothetical protein
VRVESRVDYVDKIGEQIPKREDECQCEPAALFILDLTSSICDPLSYFVFLVFADK